MSVTNGAVCILWFSISASSLCYKATLIGPKLMQPQNVNNMSEMSPPFLWNCRCIDNVERSPVMSGENRANSGNIHHHAPSSRFSLDAKMGYGGGGGVGGVNAPPSETCHNQIKQCHDSRNPDARGEN